MRMMLKAATAAVLLMATPVAAMTCDEFVGAIHASKSADLLPKFDVRQIADMPEGFLEVVNLRNIENGMTCRDGEFGSFGATLYEGAKPDRLRFAALVSAIMDAIAPNEPDRTKLAADLQAEALNEAAKEEIRTGRYSGAAESKIGEFDVSFDAMKGMIGIQVSKR